MTEAIQTLRQDVRTAADALAQDYAVRRSADPRFDADAYFSDLRRMIEARAFTLDRVDAHGAMGGGGQDEA